MEVVLSDSGGVLTALLGCRNQQRFFFSLVTPPLWPRPDLQGGYLAPLYCSTPLFIAAGPATMCGLAGLGGKVLLCSPC